MWAVRERHKWQSLPCKWVSFLDQVVVVVAASQASVNQLARTRIEPHALLAEIVHYRIVPANVRGAAGSIALHITDCEQLARNDSTKGGSFITAILTWG